jgi:hypothetical protein
MTWVGCVLEEAYYDVYCLIYGDLSDDVYWHATDFMEIASSTLTSGGAITGSRLTMAKLLGRPQ